MEPVDPHGVTMRAKGIGGTSLVIEVPPELASLVSRIEVTLVDPEMALRMRETAMAHAPVPARPEPRRRGAVFGIVASLLALVLVAAAVALLGIEPSRLPPPVQEPARAAHRVLAQTIAPIGLSVADLPRLP